MRFDACPRADSTSSPTRWTGTRLIESLSLKPVRAVDPCQMFPLPCLPRSRAAATLDVVVLGGAGHVGLPLSLVFADAGLRVGIYDINEQTLDRIGRGEMPFLEDGADELLARGPADRAARARARRPIIGRTRRSWSSSSARRSTSSSAPR